MGGEWVLLRTIWALLLGAGLLALTPARAHAETPVTACIAKLADSRTVTRPEAFDCTSRQASLGAGDFVARLDFTPQRVDPGDPLVLRTTSVWQDRADVEFRYADGSREHLSYSSGDAARYITMGAIFELPVPWRAAALESIYVEVRGAGNLRGVVLGPELMTRSESFALKSWLIALYAVFGGLTFALLVYNLALWSALRYRFQLAYCAMVAALTGYTFSSSASLTLALPWIDNNDRLRCNYMLLTLSAIAALQFFRHYFGPDIFGRRLTRWVNWLSVMSFLATSAFVLLAPWQIWVLDRFYFFGLTTLLLLVIPVIASARRSRYFGMFVIAWSAPIGVSMARAAYGFNLMGYSFWLDNGNLVALMIESALSAVMVTARLRDLSRERDHARQGEITALRLANSDPLTGLLNRRAFMDLAIGRPGRYRLMLVDIDRFKAINDRLGHDAGDEVLREVASAIQSVRPADSLAVRLGGEEFALLVPEERTFLCAPELVLEAVRCQKMPRHAKVTVSLGYAEGVLASEEGWKRLYRMADTALYRAKADGRDRACRATDFSGKQVLAWR